MRFIALLSVALLASFQLASSTEIASMTSHFSGPCPTGTYYCGAKYPPGPSGQYHCISTTSPGAWGCDQSTGAECPLSGSYNYGNANCQHSSNIPESTPLAANPPQGQSFAQGPDSTNLCPSGKYYCGNTAGSNYQCLPIIDPENSQHGCSDSGVVCTYTLGSPVSPCYNSSNIHPVSCESGKAYINGKCENIYTSTYSCGVSGQTCSRPKGNGNVKCINGQCVQSCNSDSTASGSQAEGNLMCSDDDDAK